MKKRELRVFVASLLIIVMMFGQVVQMFAIDGLTNEANGVLELGSTVSPMEIQKGNLDQGDYKQQIPQITALPTMEPSRANN